MLLQASVVILIVMCIMMRVMVCVGKCRGSSHGPDNYIPRKEVANRKHGLVRTKEVRDDDDVFSRQDSFGK